MVLLLLAHLTVALLLLHPRYVLQTARPQLFDGHNAICLASRKGRLHETVLNIHHPPRIVSLHLDDDPCSTREINSECHLSFRTCGLLYARNIRKLSQDHTLNSELLYERVYIRLRHSAADMSGPTIGPDDSLRILIGLRQGEKASKYPGLSNLRTVDLTCDADDLA